MYVLSGTGSRQNRVLAVTSTLDLLRPTLHLGRRGIRVLGGPCRWLLTYRGPGVRLGGSDPRGIRSGCGQSAKQEHGANIVCMRAWTNEVSPNVSS